MYILINRGWVAAGNSRENLPAVAIPKGPVVMEGIAVVPSSHPYELAPDATVGPLRQNLVPQRIEEETGLAMQPIILLQTSPADDALVREWPKPDAGVNTHLAYAFQWYAVAGMSAILWVALNVRKAAVHE